MTMSSSRSYLVRALYEWIVDNDCTPYLLVDAHIQGVEVPQEHVNRDGQIVLNIAPSAVRDLLVANEGLSFSARFGGIPMNIYVPTPGILGIYARENGQGMIFEPEPSLPSATSEEPTSSSEASSKPKPSVSVVDSSTEKNTSEKDDDDTPPPGGNGGPRPSLRVVK